MKLTSILCMIGCVAAYFSTTSCKHQEVSWRTATRDSLITDSIPLPDTQLVIQLADPNVIQSKEIWPLDSSFSVSILKVGTRRYLRILYPQTIPASDSSGSDCLEMFEQITPKMGWQSIYLEYIYDRNPGIAGLKPIYTQKCKDDTVMITLTRLTSKSVQISNLLLWVDTAVNIYRFQYR